MSAQQTQIVRLSIHGNIGVGKSTFIDEAERLFANNDDVHVIPVKEPTEAWTTSGMLRMVIQNPERWGVSVQYGMALTRCTYASMQEQDRVLPAVESGRYRVVVVLYERSLVDDREIFARHAIPPGPKWTMYDELVAGINSTEFDSIRCMIYLRNNDAAQCIDHIRSRHRDGEDGYNLEWIQELDRRHENMMKSCGGAKVTVPYGEGAHKDEKLVRRVVTSAVARFAPIVTKK